MWHGEGWVAGPCNVGVLHNGTDVLDIFRAQLDLSGFGVLLQPINVAGTRDGEDYSMVGLSEAY